jgi:hypothetical protein
MNVSLLNLIIDRLLEWLTDNLMTDVEDVETRAGIVKSGRLNDDPSIGVINVMIRPGGKDFPHILNASEPDGITAPAYEMGGGGVAYKRRRFMVMVDMFFDAEPQERVAQAKANTVMSRLEYFIQTMPLQDLSRDDFGETALTVNYLESQLLQSGGEGTYLFDGRVVFEYLTSTDYD